MAIACVVMAASAGSERRVRTHLAVRTLMLTRGELSAWLLDERTGATQRLNESAAVVWALLEEPSTVAELERELISEFGADEATARSLVAAAVATFEEAGLLAPHDDDDPAARDDEQQGDEPVAEEAQVLTRTPDP